MMEPRCDFRYRSCFCSRRGNQKRERFGNQRGLFRSLEFQRVLRLHDHLPAISRLDTCQSDAKPNARTGRHRGKKANLVDPVIQARRRIPGYDADLHGKGSDHGKRQVAVRDRATKGALPLRARNVDVDPLMIACAGRKRIDACLVNGHPIGDTKFLTDPFFQANQCQFPHARPPKNSKQLLSPFFSASYCPSIGFRPAMPFHGTRSGFLRASRSRNSRRRILPTFDFGSASMNCTIFGVLYAVISLRQCVTRSSFVNVAFGALTTNSLTASPVFSSGTPIQAHSMTPGHAVATASTSLG